MKYKKLLQQLMKFYAPFPADIKVLKDDVYHKIEESILSLKYEELVNQKKFSNLQFFAIMNYNKFTSDEITSEEANKWLEQMNDLIELEILKPVTKNIHN